MTEEEWKERLNSERVTVRLQRQDLEAKGDRISSLEKQVQVLKTRLEQKETEFAQREADWNEKKQYLRDRVQIAEDSKERLEENTKFLEQEVVVLKNQAQNQLEQCNAIHIKLEKYKRKFVDSFQKNNDYETEKVTLSKMLAERDRTISILNDFISELKEKNAQQQDDIIKLHESWDASGKRATPSSKKTIFNKKSNLKQQNVVTSVRHQGQKQSTPSSITSSCSSDLDNIIPSRRNNQTTSTTQQRYSLMNGNTLLSRADSLIALDTTRSPCTSQSPVSTPQASRYFDNVNTRQQQQQVEEEVYEDEDEDEEEEQQQYCNDSTTVQQDAVILSRASNVSDGRNASHRDASAIALVEEVQVTQERSTSRTAIKRPIHYDSDSTTRIQKKRSIDTAPALSPAPAVASSVTSKEVRSPDLALNLPRESSPIYFDDVATDLAVAARAQEQYVIPDDAADQESHEANENDASNTHSRPIEYSVSIKQEEEEDEESSNVINLFMTPSPPSPPQRSRPWTSSSPIQEPSLRYSLSDTTNFTAAAATTTNDTSATAAKEENSRIPSTNALQSATAITNAKRKKPVSLNTTSVDNLIPTIFDAAVTSSSFINTSHASSSIHSHARGETCMACNKFYDTGNMINPENNQVLTPKDRIQLHSRHKIKPGRAKTPPHFWSMDNFSFSPEQPKRH